MSRIAGRSSLAEGVLVDWAVEQPAFLPRLPVELLDRTQTAAELQRVVGQQAMLAAYEAELVLALADASPEAGDPLPTGRGSSWSAARRLPGVSEFFSAELSAVLNCGRGTASHLAARAWTYRESLPATWGALAAGALDEPRAKVLARVLEHADPEMARRVEATVLPEASGLSLRRLEKRAIALLLEYAAETEADTGTEESGIDQDAAPENGDRAADGAPAGGAADRLREEAQRQADVRVYPSPVDGMATVAVELPADEAAACYDVLNQLAGMLKADGDERPIGQLRTRVYVDAVLRVWDTSRPPVTAQLEVRTSLGALAGTSNEAGEVNGLAIGAGHVRELLRRLDALGVRRPEGGTVTVGVTDDDGALLASATLAQLRRLARRGCPDHPAPDCGDSGGTAAGCGCAVLGRPAAVDRYAPSAAQQLFVHTRDRTCRFPNCGQRVGWADADHVIPHACGGPTDCTNLCCLCRSHHRLKTFARGWHFEMDPDGTLRVCTPSGVTRTTRPPGLRPPPDPPRPAADADDPADAAADSAAEEVRARYPGIQRLIRDGLRGTDWAPPGPPGDPPF